MIKLTEEDPTIFEQTHSYENCVCCKRGTKFWHESTNTPICITCAKKFNLAQIKEAKEKYYGVFKKN